MGKNSWKESDLLLKGRNLKGEFIESAIPKKAQPIKKKAGRTKHSILQEQLFVERQIEGVKIHIKPLSVNKAFQGKRFHTKEHKEWSKKVEQALPQYLLPQPPYEIYLKFGFSSKASDWDNCIKQVQDSLADKYKFNDKLIRRGVVDTEIVPKGKEYFLFSIKTLK